MALKTEAEILSRVKQGYAVVISPDESTREILEKDFFTDKVDEDLTRMQKEVGGFIETVRVGQGDVIMVVDEEGVLKGRAFNPLAAEIACCAIRGNALLMREEKMK